MNEQINLLELDNDKLWQFYGHYCNDDWSAKTETVNGDADIVLGFRVKLSKNELRKICRDAIVNEADENSVYLIDKETIGQFIGLKDKNGVEIFEGDIVQYRDGEYSYLGIVKRDCYQFFIDGIEPDDSYDFIDVSNTFDETSSLEIIGNIHENPELLEGIES